jgi:hypothetical protein
MARLIRELAIEHDCDELGYSAYNPRERTPCVIQPYDEPRSPFPVRLGLYRIIVLRYMVQRLCT